MVRLLAETNRAQLLLSNEVWERLPVRAAPLSILTIMALVLPGFPGTVTVLTLLNLLWLHYLHFSILHFLYRVNYWHTWYEATVLQHFESITFADLVTTRKFKVFPKNIMVIISFLLHKCLHSKIVSTRFFLRQENSIALLNPKFFSLWYPQHAVAFVLLICIYILKKKKSPVLGPHGCDWYYNTNRFLTGKQVFTENTVRIWGLL